LTGLFERRIFPPISLARKKVPTRRIINVLVILASFVNAVPARADFHPITFRNDPIQDDLVGSGFEVKPLPTARGNKRETLDGKIAQTWRSLARQMRWLASFLDGRDSEELLARAADYEARAENLRARSTDDA
jgi:hypothetical protein